MRAEKTDEDQRNWLAEQFEALTTSIKESSPSEWAERVRYLPASNTSLPGYYRFDVTPYWREVCDCFSVDSPISEVAIKKGVQVGATTALENVIGYLIDEVRTAPAMLVTADSELAQLRITGNIIPMIQASGLSPLIKSSDEDNKRKTGKTDKKIEWFGGGFLVPFGAKNATKLRSIPIRFLFRDEIDGYPLIVGKDGDPLSLSEGRTAAFEASRKILDISTPLIKGQSNIHKRFLRGDQRYYNVQCLGCDKHQVLKFLHDPDPDTGIVGGLSWETSEAGHIVPGTARYLCRFCGHSHREEDKVRLFVEGEAAAQWIPTAVPVHPNVRSYHLSALYSLQQTWESCIRKWLEAWDVVANRPRDMGELQVFYNNVLGEPFELRGEKVKLEQISPHRRQCYRLGDVPNKWATQFAGSPILVVTAAVDVHADNLAVSSWGWTKERRAFLLDYWRFEGDTEQLDTPETWGRLRTFIENPRAYQGDDGKIYAPTLTFIDSGYRTDHVYRFCSEYSSGVAAVKGQSSTASARTAARLFSEFKPPLGERAFGISVDNYKERWAVALKRNWDGLGIQPQGHFNCPMDTLDSQLKELTVERKVEKIDPRTKQRVGWEWHRPSGSKNELWDTLIYAAAALDVLAWDYCRLQLELDQVLWPMFWDFCERGAFFQT